MNFVLARVIKYGKLVYEVIQYALLEAGWDGEHSLPPEPEAIKLAIDFIRLIPSDIPFPRPMITSTGIVGFYWDGDTAYVDIEVDRRGQFSVYSIIKKTDPKQDSWVPNLSLASFTPAFFTQHFSSLKEEQEHDRAHQGEDNRTASAVRVLSEVGHRSDRPICE
jgi:hypothetical protein